MYTQTRGSRESGARGKSKLNAAAGATRRLPASPRHHRMRLRDNIRLVAGFRRRRGVAAHTLFLKVVHAEYKKEEAADAAPHSWS